MCCNNNYYDWGLFFLSLSAKLSTSEFVSEVVLCSSIFSFSRINHIRELGAYYRADHCLLLSYNIYFSRHTYCLGFWPMNYLQGKINAEFIIIDTRTGFFLTGKDFSCFARSSSDILIENDRETEVMAIIADTLYNNIKQSHIGLYHQ